MKVAIFQPPYPHEGTAKAAINCIDWIKSQLKTLIGKNIDLIILPEYANCPGIEKIDILTKFINREGKEFSEVLQHYALALNCPILSGIAEILRSSYSIAPESPNGGYSILVDSSGKILANAESMPGVLIEDFDPNKKYSKPASYGKAKIESRFSLKNKRRPEIYRKAYEI